MHPKVWWELTFQPKGLANFENSFGYVQRAGLECNSVIGTTAAKALGRDVSWKSTYIRCKLNWLNSKTLAFFFFTGQVWSHDETADWLPTEHPEQYYTLFRSRVCAVYPKYVVLKQQEKRVDWIASLLFLKRLKFDDAFSPGSHFCWHLLCLTA